MKSKYAVYRIAKMKPEPNHPEKCEVFLDENYTKTDDDDYRPKFFEKVGDAISFAQSQREGRFIIKVVRDEDAFWQVAKDKD